MRKRFEFLGLLGLLWILLFQLFRILFLSYHYVKALELPASYWVKSAWHGLRMDVSFAGYILVLPTLLMLFTARKWQWYGGFIRIYLGIVSFAIVLLTIADLEMFRSWGFRIDATFLQYMNTPAEAWASVGAAPVFTLFCLFVLVYGMVLKLMVTITK